MIGYKDIIFNLKNESISDMMSKKYRLYIMNNYFQYDNLEEYNILVDLIK